VVLLKKWSFIQSPPEASYKFAHYDSFAEFENSAQAQRHMCRLFHDQILLDTVSLLRDPTPEPGYMALAYATSQFFCEFDVDLWYQYSARVRKIRNQLGYRMRLYLFRKDSHDYEGKFRALSYKVARLKSLVGPENAPSASSKSTESVESIQLALEWIRRCSKEHERCTRYMKQNILLARLIDIGIAADCSDVRLCSTEHLGEYIVYVALSHCWGEKRILELKDHNLADFQIQVPWLSLSKTFQDAVKMAKKLREEHNVCYM
jgi:hypothetical protein